MNAFAGLDPCVHCGFCLQSCPTFLATGDESDGPRGRIVLMQALRHRRLPADDPELAFHLDRCLGCRACEPVCPSGVEYGAALEAARHQLSKTFPAPLLARTVNLVMREPALRQPLLAAARALRPVAARLVGRSRLGFAMGMLAASADGTAPSHPTEPAGAPAQPPLPSATLFRGCIMDGLFSHVHDATIRTLATNGVGVAETPAQTCCGALHAHTGAHEAAVRLARENVAAFAAVPEQTIVVNAAGCGATLKEYGRMLAADACAADAARVSARVRDVSEVLADCGPRSGARIELRVAYDPPCHLLHAQSVAEPPLRVLDAVPGLERIAHIEAELCCGSAGSYSLSEPEMSRAVLSRKLDAITQAAPDLVASGNPGCVMQIGAGLKGLGSEIPVVHPVEVLDWSYQQAGYYDGR